MLMLIGNLEHLMTTQNGLSRKTFSRALLRPMACHPLIFLHLELTGRFPVMCHGGQTLRHSLWMLSLAVAFPPFSLILRCLKKIEMEEGEGIITVPVWPTQPWYPKLMSRLVDMPRLLPVTRGTLYLPSKPSQQHPMEGKLKIIACKLSGNPLRRKAFLQKLPRLSSSRGGKAHLNSTNSTTKNGLTSVIENRLVQFVPL